MKKNLVLLLIAFVMTFAVSMTVMAYDALQDEPTRTQYELVAVHHWVERGDTLQWIANSYGVPVADIVARNWEYFHDLFLRGTTYQLGIQLEPGVRLHIGYMLEIRHWVWRGDTLETIGNGRAFRNPDDSFGALNYGIDLEANPFTRAQIVAQNSWLATNPLYRSWFEQVRQLDVTRDINYALEESFHVLNVQNWTVTNPFAPVNTMHAFTATPMFGSPLILRTMVQPDYTRGLTGDMPYGDLVWLSRGIRGIEFGGEVRLFDNPADNARANSLVIPSQILPHRIASAEVVPFVTVLQQNSFNPWATNSVIGGVPMGWSYAPFGLAQANFLVAIGGGGIALPTAR
jgi:hypothetical protein